MGGDEYYQGFARGLTGTEAQITEPGQRKVAVLGAMSELGEYAGEEHDRVGLLAVRLRIERIVVVVPDSGERYLSTALYEHLREEPREGAK